MLENPKTTTECEERIESLLNTLSVEDEKILAAYQFLAKTNPDILFLKSQYLEPTNEQLDYYTSWHSEKYRELAKELAQEDDWNVLVIGSGMFGGKSTLSFELLDRFKEQDYKTFVSIADIMPDNYVTARSYQGRRKSREAIKYPSQEDLLKESLQARSVVLLDEFSFFPSTEPLNDLLEYAKSSDIKVVLTGLDTNYLGEPLHTYTETVEENNCKIKSLKSFIPSVESGVPIGTHTIRYVKINDMWTYDMGILPLVVSKEEEFLVHYCPATFDMTFVHMFENRPEIRDHILFPSDKLRIDQQLRKEILIEENRLEEIKYST